MSLAAFLERVVEVLDAAGVSHMLTGSLASAFYAVPRATQDIDVVIKAEREGIVRPATADLIPGRRTVPYQRVNEIVNGRRGAKEDSEGAGFAQRPYPGLVTGAGRNAPGGGDAAPC